MQTTGDALFAASKAIRHGRADFRSNLAESLEQDANCLSSQEILDLRSGGPGSESALSHLNECQACRAVQQALHVQSAKWEEFRDAVRETEPLPVAATSWNWRLVGSVASAALAATLIWFFPKPQQPAANGTISFASTSPRLEILYKAGPEAEAAFIKIPPQVLKAGVTSIEVKDVAPQLAALYVLPKTELTVKASNPEEATAEAKEQASRRLQAFFATPVASGEDTAKKLEGEGWVQSGEGWTMRLLNASMWVSSADIDKAVVVKRKALATTGSRLDLGDGQFMRVVMAKPSASAGK